jgi:hypothetical protein
MAKKKIKKPVSKRVTKTRRTTRATLDERNETLGQTAPKTRKPRAQKPKVVTTTEPAIETVWKTGSVAEFLDDTAAPQTPAAPVFIPNYPEQKVEYAAAPTRYWEIDENAEKQGFFDSVLDQIAQVKYWLTGTRKTDSVHKYSVWAFNHPMLFGIGLSALLCAIAAGVAAAMRYFKW